MKEHCRAHAYRRYRSVGATSAREVDLTNKWPCRVAADIEWMSAESTLGNMRPWSDLLIRNQPMRFGSTISQCASLRMPQLWR